MKNRHVPVSFGVREDMDLLTSRGEHPPALSLTGGLGDGGSSSRGAGAGWAVPA